MHPASSKTNQSCTVYFFTSSGVVPLRKRSQNQTKAFLNPKGENHETRSYNVIILFHVKTYNVMLFNVKIHIVSCENKKTIPSSCFMWYSCDAISYSTYLLQVQRKQDSKTILRTNILRTNIPNLYYILLLTLCWKIHLCNRLDCWKEGSWACLGFRV